MFHSITTFPYGSREGELVIRVQGFESEQIEARLSELYAIYHRSPVKDLWLDAGEIAGPGAPQRLGLALRRHWNLIVTAPVRAERWPFVPVRLFVDLSEYLTHPPEDMGVWLDMVSRKITVGPQAAEVFAVDPALEMLDPAVLHQLDVLTGAEEGCTLYVAEALFERAVQASSRASRPWTVRRLGALPPTAAAPTPAASSSA